MGFHVILGYIADLKTNSHTEKSERAGRGIASSKCEGCSVTREERPRRLALRTRSPQTLEGCGESTRSCEKQNHSLANSWAKHNELLTEALADEAG